MSKRTVRLTESDLHNIIKESVNKILKENVDSNNAYEMAIDFLEKTGLSSEDLMSEVFNWFGTWECAEWISDMRNTYNIDSEDEEFEDDNID